MPPFTLSVVVIYGSRVRLVSPISRDTTQNLYIVPNGSVAFRIEHQLLGVNFVSRKGRKKNNFEASVHFECVGIDDYKLERPNDPKRSDD